MKVTKELIDEVKLLKKNGYNREEARKILGIGRWTIDEITYSKFNFKTYQERKNRRRLYNKVRMSVLYLPKKIELNVHKGER